MIDYRTYPKGCTLDDGRFVFEELLSGAPRSGLWSGKRLEPVERVVTIALNSLNYADDLDALIRYEVPGIAPLLHVGSPDGYRRPEIRMMDGWQVAVVEARPDGETLLRVGPLHPAEVVRLGLSLCDTLQAWAQQGTICAGLRPETIFVTGPARARRLAGVIPRSLLVLGADGLGGAFMNDAFHPPAHSSIIDVALDDAVFTVGLILWYALLGEHPYLLPDRRDIHDNMWNDIRRPFTGPPEIGRLLERVLVSEVDQRMKTDELRHELERLARAWNVELPPFPPPGLAET